MIIKKESYVFSKPHGDRLRYTLLDRSFAFNFHSFESFLMLETMGIKETGEATKVTFCKDLLPRHCKLELVEDALASLETFPNNVQLLKALGDYVENSPAERRGYLLMNCATWGILVACIMPGLSPLLFVATYVLIISRVCYDNQLQKKWGKWIGDLVDGTHREPVKLAKIEANLIALIGNCKTAENIGEAAYKEMKVATAHPSAPASYLFSNDPLTNNIAKIKEKVESPASIQATEQTKPIAKIYPPLLFPSNHPEVTVQDTTSNTNDSSQEEKRSVI